MAKVLITGGTGLVGNAVSALLKQKGNEVLKLSRKQNSGKPEEIFWDIRNQKTDLNAIKDAVAVVHLAGENIGSERWTEARKAAIINSRVDATQALKSILKQANIKPIIVAASAIGYYGGKSQSLHTEDSANGRGFQAEVTRIWEENLRQLEEVADTLAILRIGIVLSKQGGALPKMITPALFGSGALGSGQQFMSWIHIQDLARLIVFCIEQRTVGTYNAVSSQSLSASEFNKALLKAMHRPQLLPNVPEWVIRLATGEMAELVLGSIKVSNAKLKQTGFSFEYDDIDLALKNLIK